MGCPIGLPRLPQVWWVSINRYGRLDRHEILDTLISSKFEVICSLSYKKYFQTTITGRHLDSELISELKRLPIDPCGEQGEYHTWVLDAPFFKASVQLEGTRIVDTPEYCYLTYERAT